MFRSGGIWSIWFCLCLKYDFHTDGIGLAVVWLCLDLFVLNKEMRTIALWNIQLPGLITWSASLQFAKVQAFVPKIPLLVSEISVTLNSGFQLDLGILRLRHKWRLWKFHGPKYFDILIPECSYYRRNLVMILEPMKPTVSLKSWIARDKAYKNAVSGMCVLLDKLVFNIHRYF